MLKSETESSTHVVGGLDESNTNVMDSDNEGGRGTEDESSDCGDNAGDRGTEDESSDCEIEIEPCTRFLRNRTRSEKQQESKRETAPPSRGFVFSSQNRAPLETARGVFDISKTKKTANLIISNGIGTPNGALQNGPLVSGSYYTICAQHRQPHRLVVFQDKDMSVVVKDLLRNNTLPQINPDAYNSRLHYTELSDQLALIEDRYRDVVAKKNSLEGQVKILETHIETLKQMNRSIKQ